MPRRVSTPSQPPNRVSASVQLTTTTGRSSRTRGIEITLHTSGTDSSASNDTSPAWWSLSPKSDVLNITCRNASWERKSEGATERPGFGGWLRHWYFPTPGQIGRVRCACSERIPRKGPNARAARMWTDAVISPLKMPPYLVNLCQVRYPFGTTCTKLRDAISQCRDPWSISSHPDLSPWGPSPSVVRRLRLYKLRFAQAWEPPFATDPFPRAQPPRACQHEVAETHLPEMSPSFGRGKTSAQGCGEMMDDAGV